MIEKEADDESHARSQTLIDNKAMVHSWENIPKEKSLLFKIEERFLKNGEAVSYILSKDWRNCLSEGYEIQRNSKKMFPKNAQLAFIFWRIRVSRLF